MHGDKMRVPLEAKYLEALGRAVYVFAALEWNVVGCCERIKPDCINKISELTSGKISKVFNNLLDDIQDESTRLIAITLAAWFADLVKKRGGINHGKPGMGEDGGQQLFRFGKPWLIPELEQVTDEFAACGGWFNDLLNDHLRGSR